jgi:hypothetical protein
MRRKSLIQFVTFWDGLKVVVFFSVVSVLSATAMELRSGELTVPTEIVVTDDYGLVERMQTGPMSAQNELNLWVVKEIVSQNKDLEAQIASYKKKWYISLAGIAGTVIPLIVCGVELYNSVHDCK